MAKIGWEKPIKIKHYTIVVGSLVKWLWEETYVTFVVPLVEQINLPFEFKIIRRLDLQKLAFL